MKIGIPKEIKNNENRVSCTPAGVFALCKQDILFMWKHLPELAVVLKMKNI